MEKKKKLKSRVSILARLADIRLCSTGQKNMHFYGKTGRPGHLFLCDLETGDIKKYTGKYAPYFKYYSTTTSCIEDNVLALSMYGEDNQFYVCLINADTMKEIADPIAGESFSMEDKTLLIDQKELYDLSGNLLYTVEDGKKENWSVMESCR